ncbi:MAG: Flp family type IVb pilin [Gaiellaceae bacterium]
MLKLFTYAQVYAMESIDSFRKREEGQTMAEYAVVLGLITLLVVGAIGVLSGRINTVLRDIATRF